MAGDSEAASAPNLTTTRRRGPGRPFQAGQSGNPSGFPRGVAGKIMRCRKLALGHAPKAIETLAQLLDNEDSRVRVAAAEGLLDRAGLRPFSLEPERVQVTAAVVDVDALRAELARRLVSLAGLAEGRDLNAPADPAPAVGGRGFASLASALPCAPAKSEGEEAPCDDPV